MEFLSSLGISLFLKQDLTNCDVNECNGNSSPHHLFFPYAFIPGTRKDYKEEYGMACLSLGRPVSRRKGQMIPEQTITQESEKGHKVIGHTGVSAFIPKVSSRL